MEEPGVISDYADRLAGKLSFDRALSRRVRQEVEDHLRDAVAADRSGDPRQAERRAIARFGDPHAIAAQFAVAALARQARRAGLAVILVIAGVFVAMKARIVWYALTQWALSDQAQAVSGIVGAIDFYAFWLAVIVGTAGWAYIGSRRTPAAFDPAYRRQLRCFFRLSAVATAVLIASVISDGVLTALRLLETTMSAAFLVPILSMAIEIACAGLLVFQIRGATRRMASTAALMGA